MIWKNNFTERQQKEIEFCKMYASKEFRHGTDGHNARMIIAQFADLLKAIESEIDYRKYHINTGSDEFEMLKRIDKFIWGYNAKARYESSSNP